MMHIRFGGCIVTNIYRRFSIRSRESLSLVIPNNKTRVLAAESVVLLQCCKTVTVI